MVLGVHALPVRRVREPHGSRLEQTGTAVVAHVDPEPAHLRLLVAGRKHRDRRVVRMKLVGGHRVATQLCDS